MEALGWIARVGMTPIEPVALVMGWSLRRAFDHVARLDDAGLVRRVPMTRGDGSMIVVTREGAGAGGQSALGAPRTVSPTTWAHGVGTAWAAAWCEVAGRSWLSERELRLDSRWDGEIAFTAAGGLARRRHRPDLGALNPKGGPPIAIEVELQQKSAERLRAILAMYDDRIRSSTLSGLVYVTGTEKVEKAVRSAAKAVSFEKGLTMLSLDDMMAEVRRAREGAGA